MKVLMVTSSYPKFRGDVTAPFIESIAHAVAARGHEVDVVLPQHPELRRDGVEPVRFLPYAYAPRDDWSRWGYAQSLEADVRVRRGVYLLAPLAALALRRQISQALADRRYDVVHAHWVVPNAALISDIAAAHRAPLVVSLHGSDVFLAEHLRGVRALASAALRRAGAVTACSDDLRRRGIALGASAAHSRVVPYGVDVEALRVKAGASRAPMRLRLGTPVGHLLVLGLGRLVEKKGFRTLVEAAARVQGVHVAIVGEGDLRRELEELATRVGASVSLPGRLEHTEVGAALAAADIVAVPSVVDAAGNVDGLPNVLMEALGAGRPVVASRVAGIPDVVQDGVTGVLVPPADAAALAEALGRLAGDEALRQRLAEQARAAIARHYTWAHAGRTFEECYAEAASLDAR